MTKTNRKIDPTLEFFTCLNHNGQRCFVKLNFLELGIDYSVWVDDECEDFSKCRTYLVDTRGKCSYNPQQNLNLYSIKPFNPFQIKELWC